jgi:hypothetical protein
MLAPLSVFAPSCSYNLIFFVAIVSYELCYDLCKLVLGVLQFCFEIVGFFNVF